VNIELALARQVELLANRRKIETMAAYEQMSRLDRLQRSLRTARARLGLLPARAS
jgi:hypothetical protein